MTEEIVIALPNAWLKCPSQGNLIADLFIPFKTLLDRTYNPVIPLNKRFNANSMQKQIAKFSIRLLVDLTTSSDFYNPRELRKIFHLKLFDDNEKGFPTEEHIYAFIQYIDETLLAYPDAKIGVHCIHGFNKTGFMIVSYLIKVRHMELENAINLFAEARPPGIYRKDYIEELKSRYNPNASIKIPKLPEWFSESNLTTGKSKRKKSLPSDQDTSVNIQSHTVLSETLPLSSPFKIKSPAVVETYLPTPIPSSVIESDIFQPISISLSPKETVVLEEESNQDDTKEGDVMSITEPDVQIPEYQTEDKPKFQKRRNKSRRVHYHPRYVIPSRFTPENMMETFAKQKKAIINYYGRRKSKNISLENSLVSDVSPEKIRKLSFNDDGSTNILSDENVPYPYFKEQSDERLDIETNKIEDLYISDDIQPSCSMMQEEKCEIDKDLVDTSNISVDVNMRSPIVDSCVNIEQEQDLEDFQDDVCVFPGCIGQNDLDQTNEEVNLSYESLKEAYKKDSIVSFESSKSSQDERLTDSSEREDDIRNESIKEINTRSSVEFIKSSTSSEDERLTDSSDREDDNNKEDDIRNKSIKEINTRSSVEFIKNSTSSEDERLTDSSDREDDNYEEDDIRNESIKEINTRTSVEFIKSSTSSQDYSETNEDIPFIGDNEPYIPDIIEYKTEEERITEFDSCPMNIEGEISDSFEDENVLKNVPLEAIEEGNEEESENSEETSVEEIKDSEETSEEEIEDSEETSEDEIEESIEMPLQDTIMEKEEIEESIEMPPQDIFVEKEVTESDLPIMMLQSEISDKFEKDQPSEEPISAQIEEKNEDSSDDSFMLVDGIRDAALNQLSQKEKNIDIMALKNLNEDINGTESPNKLYSFIPKFFVSTKKVVPITDYDYLESLRNTVKTILRTRMTGFIGTKYELITWKSYEDFIFMKENAYNTWITNGRRYMMYIENEVNMFFIDENNWFYRITDMIIPHYADINRRLTTTIFDGEFVIDHVGETDFHIYLISNVYMIEGNFIDEITFMKRLGMIENVTLKPRSTLSKIQKDNEPFEIGMKKFLEKVHLNYVWTQLRQVVPHKMTALAFYPNATNKYKHLKENPIFYWKPPEEKTIDFKLKMYFDSDNNRWVGNLHVDGDSKPYAAILKMSEAELKLYDNMIVKCQLNKEGDEWKIVEEQRERNVPVASYEIIELIEDLMNPVPYEELL